MFSVSVLLAAAVATPALDRPFEVEWFEKTPAYRQLLQEAKKTDPTMPNVTLTKADIDGFLARAEVGKRELDWVKKYASPLSPRRQNKRVRSVMHILTSKKRVALGKKFAAKYQAELDRVSKKYDVSVEDLLGMMNAESRFGEVQGTFVVGNVFVANMAYLSAAEAAADKRGDYDQPGAVSKKKNHRRVTRRERYSVRNLVTLLRYARSRNADAMDFKGSWAGAIGITQFMPASLKWAVDGDENGVVDLSTVPDAIASTANYLVVHGYRRGNLGARKKAFHAYNPNAEYVKAIVAYADRIR